MFLHNTTSNKRSTSNIPQELTQQSTNLSEIQIDTSFIDSASTPNDLVSPSPSHDFIADIPTPPPTRNYQPPQPPKKKIKYVNQEEESSFFQSMKSLNDEIIDSVKNKENDSLCEDTLYCQRLIPIFKGLPLKKKRFATVEINKLLFKIEFDEEV